MKCDSAKYPEECKTQSLGKIIDTDMNEYEGEYLVFHTPAEHKINGKQYQMEL